MRRNSRLILFVSILMVLAFATVALAAAPAMVSATKTFKANGAKVVMSKTNVMTITKGKIVIVINAKQITKNKVVVKNTKGKYKLAKKDYLIQPALAKTLLPAPPKPAAKPAVPAKPATPATPAKPGVTPAVPATPATPATPAAPAVVVPAGLTGDKATAYTMLIKSKFSGTASSDWKALIQVGIPLGDVNIKMATATSGKGCKITTIDGVPGTVGGNSYAQGKSFAKMPFVEVADSQEAALTAFLKEANDVSISGTTINVAKTMPPQSIVDLLNGVARGVTWDRSKLDMTCKINLDASGNVASISGIHVVGKCNTTLGVRDGTVDGSAKF